MQQASCYSLPTTEFFGGSMKWEMARHWRRFVCALMALSFGALAACTPGLHNYDRIADPAVAGNATVAVIGKELDVHVDVASGSYYDKEHQVVVSGHQKGLESSQVGGFIVLGPIGALIALSVGSKVNEAHGRSSFAPTVGRASADIPDLALSVLSEMLADGSAPLWSLSTENPTIAIHPYAIFTILESGKSRWDRHTVVS